MAPWDDILADLRGHLVWLADAGVGEIPAPPPAPKRAAAPAAALPAPPVPHRAGAPPPPPLAGEGGAGIRRSHPVSNTHPASSPEEKLTLLQIRADLGDCRRCKLAPGRKNLVFGVGNPSAELVFVGEGPGSEEDLRGEPFVGPAGQLLDRMIAAMGFSRGQVYICNVVKCRPPKNRNPEPDEMDACAPFLRAQIASIRPKVLVALGKIAAQHLLSDSTPITRMRGRWRKYAGIPLMPTFHPAYLLRNPADKGKVWEDLKAVVTALGRTLPKA